MQDRRGFFIAIEGPEGAGKSTQKMNMEEYLTRLGCEVVPTREPGGTPLAEEIRAILLKPRDEDVSNTTELLLMFAARAQHVEKVILPALERGAIVVCDRFVDSTYAYQCGGRGLEYSRIEEIENYTLGGLKPDLTFYFDVDLETGMKRAAARGALDRFESEVSDFFKRVAAMYRQRYELDPARYYRVDANQNFNGVWNQIKPELDRIFESLTKRK